MSAAATTKIEDALANVFANYSVELESLISHTAATNKILCIALWRVYRLAGAPYGITQAGLNRWLRENKCEDAKHVEKRESDLLTFLAALRERRVP